MRGSSALLSVLFSNVITSYFISHTITIFYKPVSIVHIMWWYHYFNLVFVCYYNFHRQKHQFNILCGNEHVIFNLNIANMEVLSI